MYCKEAPKIIAVDLDQTLAHTLERLIEWHNDTFGTDFSVTDFYTTTEYWKIWGGSRQETCMKIREFYESDYFDKIEPIHDFALEALKMLKSRHFTLVVITSRQQFIADKTKKFIDKHYPGIFDSIYFCNLNLSDTEQLDYISKPKSVICQEIGVDVLIDNSLEHVLDCSSLGIDILLYDKDGTYRWNHENRLQDNSSSNSSGPYRRRGPTLTSTSKRLYQHTPKKLSKNVHRVTNWKQIIAQFPKPSSPLKNCCYSDEQEEEDDMYESEDEGYPNNSSHPQHHYSYNDMFVNDNRVWV